MSHGRPDFFGTPIHPRYGTARSEFETPAADSRVFYPLITVNAKGLAVGGVIRTIDPDSAIGDLIYIDIDGERAAVCSWAELMHQQYVVGLPFPLVILIYDVDTPQFNCGIGVELPFENQIIIGYYVAGLNPVTLACRLTYYDLE